MYFYRRPDYLFGYSIEFCLIIFYHSYLKPLYPFTLCLCVSVVNNKPSYNRDQTRQRGRQRARLSR